MSVFLRELRWHLSGLSELPLVDVLSFSAGSNGTSLGSQISHLNNAFLYHLPASVSPFFWKKSLLFFSFLLLWAFYICTTMLSSIYRKHSTAQSGLHNAANQVRADQSITTPADRVGESQYVVEHFFSPLRSQIERRNQNRPGLQKNIQPLTKRVSWCDVRRICLYFQSR